MDEFDFARSVTVGQYVPGTSIVHRLDPRAKLAGFVIVLAAIITSSSYLGNVVGLAAAIGLVVLAGLPVGYVLSGVKPIIPILVVFTFFNFLFLGNYDPTGSPVLWQQPVAIGPYEFAFTVTENSMKQTVQGVVRIIALIVLTSLLTLTTTITGLAKAIEVLLAPFRRVKVPAHEAAMVLAIAYRFVPTVADELERLMKAQASRGADFGRPGRLKFIKRAKQMVPITVPLFVGAFRRAERLIMAMESRCYIGGHGRTPITLPPLGRRDWAALASASVFTLAMWNVPWPL
ncbi:MAG: energy-coupling factor transporter transmembrane component T family protein [Candidatus Limnocylindria bacterium]